LGVEEPQVERMEETNEQEIDHSMVKEEPSAYPRLGAHGPQYMEESNREPLQLLQPTPTGHNLASSSHVPISSPSRSSSPAGTNVPRPPISRIADPPHSGPYLIRILHLPFTLPKHRLHEFALKRISANQILSVHIRSNTLDREATGHVEVASSESQTELIRKVDGDRYEGATLAAVPCSSVEKDHDFRPLVPHRPSASSNDLVGTSSPRSASSIPFDQSFANSRTNVTVFVEHLPRSVYTSDVKALLEGVQGVSTRDLIGPLTLIFDAKTGQTSVSVENVTKVAAERVIEALDGSDYGGMKIAVRIGSRAAREIPPHSEPGQRGRSPSRSPPRHLSRSPPRRRSRSPRRRISSRRSPSFVNRYRSPPPLRRTRSPSPHSIFRRRSCSPPRQRSKTSHNPSLQPDSPPKQYSRFPRPFDPALYSWIFVRLMPRDWSERKLYETLEGEGITAFHIILRRRSGNWSRSAHVAVESKEACRKAKELLESLTLSDRGRRVEVEEYVAPPGTLPTHYPPASLQSYPYQPPTVSANNLPLSRLKQIVVKYIPRSVTRSQLLQRIEEVVGSRGYDVLNLMDVNLPHSADPEQLATVDSKSIEDCKSLIKELDGTLLNGDAVYVTWQRGRNDPYSPPPINRNTSTNLRNRSPSPDSRRPRNRNRSLSPPRPASNSTLNSQPSSSSASRQLELDLSRIRSLNLSREDLEAIQRIWTPLDSAPPSTTEGNFQRQISLSVQFGFLPQSDASLALKSNESSPAYPDDPLLQTRFTKFLESQAGITRDHYTVFFSQITDWNVYCEQFSNRGREEAEKVRSGGRDTRMNGNGGDR